MNERLTSSFSRKAAMLTVSGAALLFSGCDGDAEEVSSPEAHRESIEPSDPIDFIESPLPVVSAPEYAQNPEPLEPSFRERLSAIPDVNGVESYKIQYSLQLLVEVHGFSEQGAAMFTGNLLQESALNPCAVGDGGQAEGIVQWHPPRRSDDFPYGEGCESWEVTFAAQLNYAVDELKERAYGRAEFVYTNDFSFSIEDYRDANYNYERYGHEGDRIDYGVLIADSIGRPVSADRSILAA